MAASSSTAASSSFGFWDASPSPMFRTIFSSRGTAIWFSQPRSRMSAGTRSLRYRSCSREIMSGVLERLAAAATHADGHGVARPAVTDPRRLVTARADRKDIRKVDRRLLLDDAPRLLHAPRLRVPLDQVDPLDDDPVPLGEHAQHLAGLAALFASDDHDGVVPAQPTERHVRAPPGRAR